jgi:hypothetical protein
MDLLTNLGIYTLICAALVGVAIGGVYLKKKFVIKDSEIDLGKKIIGLLVYIAQKGNFKYKGDVTVIAKYVLEAINFVDEFETAETIDIKKELVSEEALQICKENGVNVDPELIQIIDSIVDYFVK